MTESNLNRLIRHGFDIQKQPYTSLSEEDVEEVARKVEQDEGIDRVKLDAEERDALKSLKLYTVAKTNWSRPESRQDALYSFKKEYEAQIKDITQPQGGTENFTNVRSPGQAPGKVSAEPGRSGRNVASSTYSARDGKELDLAGQPFSYDVSPGNPSGAGGRENPQARIETAQAESSALYPEATYIEPSYQATKPGDVRPSYSGQGPKPKVPSQSRPEGGVSKGVEFNRELLIRRARLLSQHNYSVPTTGKIMKQAFELMRKTGPQVRADEDAAFQAIAAPAPVTQSSVTEEIEEGRRFDETMDEAGRLDDEARKLDAEATEQEYKGCYSCRDELRRQAMLVRERAIELRKGVRPNFGSWRN